MVDYFFIKLIEHPVQNALLLMSPLNMTAIVTIKTVPSKKTVVWLIEVWLGKLDVKII